MKLAPEATFLWSIKPRGVTNNLVLLLKICVRIPRGMTNSFSNPWTTLDVWNLRVQTRYDVFVCFFTKVDNRNILILLFLIAFDTNFIMRHMVEKRIVCRMQEKYARVLFYTFLHFFLMSKTEKKHIPSAHTGICTWKKKCSVPFTFFFSTFYTYENQKPCFTHNYRQSNKNYWKHRRATCPGHDIMQIQIFVIFSTGHWILVFFGRTVIGFSTFDIYVSVG